MKLSYVHEGSSPHAGRRAPGKLLRSAALLAGLAACSLAGSASADSTALWAAEKVGAYAGDLCAYGSQDCNTCANDVLGTWNHLAQQGLGSMTLKRVPAATGSRAPYGDNLEAMDGVRSHFQGLTRFHVPLAGKSLPGHWFAHSMDGSPNLRGEGPRPDGLALSYRPLDGSQPGSVDFYYAMNSPGSHIGGIQSLGVYMFAAIDDEGSTTSIAMFDFSDPTLVRPYGPNTGGYNAPRRVKYLPIGGITTRASSVGVARLFNGKYATVIQRRATEDAQSDWDLLEVTSPTSDSYSNRVVRHSAANLSPHGADNLALITECNTGRIYAVGATGPNNILPANGANIWTLLEIRVDTAGNPKLVYLDERSAPRYNADQCQVRGAATVYVDEDHRMVMACHEKLAGGNTWDWQEWRKP